MPKSGYGEVRPGTGRAQVLAALMMPCGVTAEEAVEEGWVKDKGAFGSSLEDFRDMFGYDVRGFPCPGLNKRAEHHNAGRWCKIYRVVGRWTWDGDYTSYIDDELDDIVASIFKERGIGHGTQGQGAAGGQGPAA